MQNVMRMMWNDNFLNFPVICGELAFLEINAGHLGDHHHSSIALQTSWSTQIFVRRVESLQHSCPSSFQLMEEPNVLHFLLLLVPSGFLRMNLVRWLRSATLPLRAMKAACWGRLGLPG